MLFRQLFDAGTSSYTYLLADQAEAVLIDPVFACIERDLALIGELGLSLKYALDTHVHADHITAAGALRRRVGCKTVASASGPESADIRLKNRSSVGFGEVTLTGLTTPGHTSDSMCFLLGDDPGGARVFTGDTLLVRGCGRTDFQNGDAGTLYDSIERQLFSLPERTQVWPGHDYRGQTTTTIGEEKAHNPRLAGKSRAEFIKLMDQLDLPTPKRLHEAVPANQELGVGVGASGRSEAFNECSGAALVAGVFWEHIVDVRQPHEFTGELGHIPGAINVPMSEVADFAAGLRPDTSVLVVCRSGRRSREACTRLAAQGMSNLTNLEGGMLRYREQGLKIA